MGNFIEVTERYCTSTFLDDENTWVISEFKTVINTDFIIRFSQNTNGCFLVINEGHQEQPICIHVVETYDYIKYAIINPITKQKQDKK